MRGFMNTKIFLIVFSVILTSVESSAPKVGRLSLAFIGAVEKAQLRAQTTRAKVRRQLTLQKEIIAFAKTDEFKDLIKTNIETKKIEVKKQCTCLHDHAKSPRIREIMIGAVVVHVAKSIDQTLNTKAFITTTDITIAVAQAMYDYAKNNTTKDKQ